MLIYTNNPKAICDSWFTQGACPLSPEQIKTLPASASMAADIDDDGNKTGWCVIVPLPNAPEVLSNDPMNWPEEQLKSVDVV